MAWQSNECARMGKISCSDLLPGDLISLRGKRVAAKPVALTSDAKKKADEDAKKPGAKSPVQEQHGADIVPCDCLVLSGSAVVNESTLTGESVPLMKDAIKPDSKDDELRNLTIDGRDRMHTLFSGTTIVSARSTDFCNAKNPSATGNKADKTESAGFPKAPDDGCLCYVLRTGFNSSQGELVQLIEFSQEKVSADSKEVFVALFLLLIFALVAAVSVTILLPVRTPGAC